MLVPQGPSRNAFIRSLIVMGSGTTSMSTTNANNILVTLNTTTKFRVYILYIPTRPTFQINPPQKTTSKST